MENINAISRQSEQLEKIRDALTLLNYPGKRNIREMRKRILGLEAAMQAMPTYVPGEKFKTSHRFDKGIYIRECVIPKGFTVTGKIHKYGHWNFLVKGTISVWTEEGMKTLTAPVVLQSQSGIKRVGYAHEETVWITVHSNPSDERDIKKVEAQLFADTFDEAYLTSPRTFEDAIRFLGFSPEEVTSLSQNESDQVPFPCATGVRIGHSPIHGEGLFAIRRFEAGETIVPGRIGEWRTPAGRYTNHSADPNSKAVMLSNGDVNMIALKSIEVGDEILNDYYFTYTATRPMMEPTGEKGQICLRS